MQASRYLIFMRSLVFVIALVALGISALLFQQEMAMSGALPGCGAGSGCAEVFASGWGYWFSVPVAGFAVGVYILVVALLANLSFAKDRKQRRIASYLLIGCAVAITAAALWFIFVQVFVIGAICKYCMSVHILGLVFSLLLVAPLFLKSSNPKRYAVLSRGLRFKMVAVMVVLGLAGAAILAAGEFVSHAPQSRTISYGGIAINVKNYPIIGNSNAKHIFILFADYTCPYCRKMHHYLRAALDRFGADQIAFAVAPMPLDSKCNPYVKHTEPIHEGGCELAKIALAVWEIAPDKFGKMDHWLFAADHKRSISAALKKAQQLVGNGASVKKVMQQKWIEQFIHAQIKLNHILGNRAKVDGIPVGDNIPKLILTGSFMEVGLPRSQKAFLKELENKFKIQPTK